MTEKKYLIEIGNRLRIFRETLGLSQRAVAEKLGTGPMNVSRYELGQRKLDPHITKKYVEILGLNPVWLFTGKGPLFLADKSVEDLRFENTFRSKSEVIRWLPFTTQAVELYVPEPLNDFCISYLLRFLAGGCKIILTRLNIARPPRAMEVAEIRDFAIKMGIPLRGKNISESELQQLLRKKVINAKDYEKIWRNAEPPRRIPFLEEDKEKLVVTDKKEEEIITLLREMPDIKPLILKLLRVEKEKKKSLKH